MRVSPINSNTNGCQPLKFAHRQQSEAKSSANCCNNLEQKYDLACRIIALQKQQILALQAKDKK